MITQNILGYQLSGTSGKFIYGADPGTMTTLPEAFETATVEETNLAVEKAFEAWRIYRKVPGTQKAAFLNEIANGIEGLGQVLVSRVMQETAYPEARVLVERNRTCAQLRMFAEVAHSGAWKDITVDPALPERAPAPRPELRKLMMPLGPVVVFGASNFPLAYSTAGGDVSSALAVGCPVIVKAHDSHLGTNALVAEVIMDAARKTGMPDGVFSSLNGNGLQTGMQLVQHPLTAAVGFTGSLKGGRALFDLGQQRPRPIPVFAEMGSVNPVFLLPAKIKEDAKSLASQLVNSMTMSAGQFCTKPGILVALHDHHTGQLTEELKSELEKIPEATLLNQGIFKSFHHGVATIREDEGVIIVHDFHTSGDLRTSPVLATVPAQLFLARPGLHHEIFGPYSIMVLCEDLHQMHKVASALEGQLTATIHATGEEQAETIALVDILAEKAGRIILNGVPTGVEVCSAMTHGGPYPASTDSRYSAVGQHAVRRWVRPVTLQNFTLFPGPVVEITG
jgi:NADP-dependent aldehyde dehydrogenase